MANKVKGVDTVKRALQNFVSRSIEGTGRGLRKWGEETMTYAKKSTNFPVETGNLRASGVVEGKDIGGSPAVELSFGGQAPAGGYAVVVHEKTYKYLEIPVNEKSKDLIPTVGEEVKKETGMR